MFIDNQGLRWYKGNLHTHTTCSDGQRTPEQTISLYRGAGYDFLALTDHWHVSETESESDFLLLSGCEYDVGRSVQEGIFHIAAIGMEQDPGLERCRTLTAQNVINEVNGAGGIAVLAHPAWSMNRPEDLMKLTGLAGAEIYNTTSGVPWNARPYSGVILDDLAARGNPLRCMAADDAHWYNGDETRSFLMVQAEELSPAAILGALRAGRFYASQGPRLLLRIEGDCVIAECEPGESGSPVREVVFFTDMVYAPDRVTRGDNLRKAAYQIQPGATFVRAEAADEAGNAAWTSYLPLR